MEPESVGCAGESRPFGCNNFLLFRNRLTLILASMQMKKILTSPILWIALANLLACSHRSATAEALTIPNPDDPSKHVEAFFKRPLGHGPWPAVVLLHGHQSWPSAGGADFVKWGVLDKYAQRGYLAVAVSEPGFGNSSGPPDFCGPLSQDAVIGVISQLRRKGLIEGDKVVLEGVSMGAIVAGLIAAHGQPLAGVVLISGVYDFPLYAAKANSAETKGVVKELMAETDGSPEALRARSVLYSVQSIRTPMLILNGAKDDRTDPSQARRLADEVTLHGGSARAIIYPSFRHYIPVEVRDKVIDPFIDGVLRK